VSVECEASGIVVRCRRSIGLTIECSTELATGRDREAVAAELVALVEAVADDLEACLRRLT
jgi:hypothetical protein